MTTPTTPYITVNTGTLIGLALGKIRGVPLIQPVSGNEFARALSVFGVMISAWRNSGFQIWKRQLNYLFPVAGQSVYNLSETGDNWTNSYLQFSMGTAVAQGANSITLVSAAGISANDHIGVMMDDGTRYWTTVIGVPAGNVVTIAGVLPTTAALGNAVYSYTTKPFSPLNIYAEGNFRRVYGGANPVDIPILMISNSDYQNLPSKSANGSIIEIMYNQPLSGGKLHVWSPPSNSADIIGLSCQEPYLQPQTPSDTVDFPQQYYEALIDGLAWRMCAYYKSDLNERRMLGQEALESLKLAMDFNEESASVCFQPEFNR